MRQVELISAALSRLLKRKNDDAFVIIEDSSSGKFVQFAVNAFQEIIFDLPFQALDPMERTRATALLRISGITFEEWDLQEEPGGAYAGKQRGFGKNYGGQTELAAELAWKIFTEVYALKEPITLIFEEN